ncbi:Cobalamin (Vitamin B12) biosynthesis CbiM protein [Nocardia brasiliensis ATCC 700358]|uniref:Cobalamin (Vitamin B12) biosynthesis CbiM protein n=2 Tax=Nocardia brasiliensis TaxID=37326 RepID=K0F473_NOCB7|nr:Cobalamin (Vitamin B12) biosynthesis CbiM protein [Nocardia brasiliensis ATCC 700358]
MSDGIVDVPASALFAVIAVAGLGFAAWRARAELDERAAPMAGLVAAFIFAVQMVNFPILPGVSGHLLGGALAAILVGPHVGALCVAIVLVVQALLFADGGLSALGTNITNMALIGVAVGYSVARWTLPVLVDRVRSGIGIVAFLAAFVGTVCAAMGFVLEYAIGGAAGSTVGAVAGYMLITHALIGVGEGIITAITVVAVVNARPDLVYLLRRARGGASPVRARVSMTGFLWAFAAVAVLIAGLLSYVASSQPDGLDATTQRGCTVVETEGVEELRGECIAQSAEEHRFANSPLADYTIDGDDGLTGLAGVLGAAAAFAALFAVLRMIRAGRARGRETHAHNETTDERAQPGSP